MRGIGGGDRFSLGIIVARRRSLTPRNKRESMPYHADRRPTRLPNNTRTRYATGNVSFQVGIGVLKGSKL